MSETTTSAKYGNGSCELQVVAMWRSTWRRGLLNPCPPIKIRSGFVFSSARGLERVATCNFLTLNGFRYTISPIAHRKYLERAHRSDGPMATNLHPDLFSTCHNLAVRVKTGEFWGKDSYFRWLNWAPLWRRPFGEYGIGSSPKVYRWTPANVTEVPEVHLRLPNSEPTKVNTGKFI